MSRPHPAVLVPIVGGVLILVWIVTAPSHTADVVYLWVTGPAAIVAALAARHAPPANRRAAGLIAAGLGFLWGGDLLWTVWTWRGLDPEPSVADLSYLTGYAVLAAGIVLLMMPPRAGRRRVDADVVVDVLTVVTVCVLGLWELAIRDTAGGLSSSLGATLARTELIYPLVDAVLIGLVLGAMVHRGSRQLLGVGFGVGVMCWMVGDFAYLIRAAEDTALRVSSVTWLVGTLLVAASVQRLSRGPTTAATSGGPMSRTTTRLLLAVGPLVVPPLLAVGEILAGREPAPWSLLVGIGVLIALAFVRTVRLLATERRVREELAVTRDEALQASRAKSVFLASLSHEIRTPMNGVLGLTRLLSDTELDPEQRHYADGINRAGESLMALLGEILDFAKLEDGRTQVDAADVDLVTVVEDTAAMVAAQAHHQGIELVAHTAADLPRHLCGDPAKLRQVLLNLAANAVAWTSAGEVVVRASLAPTGADPVDPDTFVVRFEVRDTGVGIAEADQRRIFEVFTQVEEEGQTARRGDVGGTGLGLAIARSLVQAMGGTIGVESTPGAGSTFWFTVPLHRTTRRQAVVTRPSRAAVGARVLVVDDNASQREMLAELLGIWGLCVDLAADGDAAMELFRQAAASGTPYVLALVDLQMPEPTGLQLVHQVRALGFRTVPPVVAMASGPLPAAELRRAGIEVSLPKPVRTAQLQAAVQRALGADPDRPEDLSTEPAATRGAVLVVDDSEVNRLVAAGMLSKLGYLSDVAADGEQAVEMVAAHHYDAVLMDCRMPVLDGYQATAAIRRRELDQPRARRVPIVALTAHALAGEREGCLAAGMDDYLIKPLGQRPLAEVLERWVPTPVG